jgi:RimJ/RimL family protein N-acetyltransferase
MPTMNAFHQIGPDDLELERRFIHRLTPRSKRMRFLAAVGEPSEAQLLRLVSPNPRTELALAWIHGHPGNDGQPFRPPAVFTATPAAASTDAVTNAAWAGDLNGEFAAVARYSIVDGTQGLAEFAIVVADQFQSQGIGRKLLNGLIQAARESGLRTLQGECFSDNQALLELCKGLGFVVSSHPDDASLAMVRLALVPNSIVSESAYPKDHTSYQ